MGNCSSSRAKHSFKGLLLESVLYNPQSAVENKKVRSHFELFQPLLLK